MAIFEGGSCVREIRKVVLKVGPPVINIYDNCEGLMFSSMLVLTYNIAY